MERTVIQGIEIGGMPIGLASLLEATLEREGDDWVIVVVSQFSSDLVDALRSERYPEPVEVSLKTDAGERLSGKALITLNGDVDDSGKHVEVLFHGEYGSLVKVSKS